MVRFTLNRVLTLILQRKEKKMKLNRYFIYFMTAIFLGGLVVGCKPRIDTMSKAEKIFIKKIDKTAGKLDLNKDQKMKLEGLKAEIRKNFQEGASEKKEAWMKIKEDAAKENPDIQKMTSLLQGMLRNEAQRFNKALNLLTGFQDNLNEVQKKKLTQMISEWVKKWD
jgi:uncharacterized membrane-anchored protein YjiN (DUF445 family)